MFESHSWHPHFLPSYCTDQVKILMDCKGSLYIWILIWKCMWRIASVTETLQTEVVFISCSSVFAFHSRFPPVSPPLFFSFRYTLPNLSGRLKRWSLKPSASFRSKRWIWAYKRAQSLQSNFSVTVFLTTLRLRKCFAEKRASQIFLSLHWPINNEAL